MPAAGRSVGRDLSIVLIDANFNGGQSLSWPVISTVDFKQKVKTLNWISLDGQNSYADIPQGWDVTVMVDRANGAVMNYIVAAEASYFSGSSTSQFYLSATITNADGSVSQYRFVDGTASLSDGGKFTGDDKVSLKVDLKFARCLRII